MQEGAELQQRYMRAAPRREHGHSSATAPHGGSWRRRITFVLFSPCLFVALFLWVFFPRLYSQIWLLQLRRRPTNESVSDGTPGENGKTRMDVCVTPASLFFQGMCKRRLPQPLPRRAEMRLRLGTGWTVSVEPLPFVPRLFTIAALPAPLCALGDAPRPPSSGGESPASPLHSPLLGPCAPPSFPRPRFTQPNAGWTDPRPSCRPPRPGPLRRSPPSGGGERKALIDPRARPAW